MGIQEQVSRITYEDVADIINQECDETVESRQHDLYVMILRAVMKQVPLKVAPIQDGIGEMCVCPKCEKLMLGRRKLFYCMGCGQLLEWED